MLKRNVKKNILLLLLVSCMLFYATSETKAIQPSCLRPVSTAKTFNRGSLSAYLDTLTIQTPIRRDFRDTLDKLSAAQYLSNRQLAFHCKDNMASLKSADIDVLFDNIVRIYDRKLLLIPIKVDNVTSVVCYTDSKEPRVFNPNQLGLLDLPKRAMSILSLSQQLPIEDKVKQVLGYIGVHIEADKLRELLRYIRSIDFEPVKSEDWQWIFATTLDYLYSQGNVTLEDAIKILIERQMLVGDVKDISGIVNIKTGRFAKQYNVMLHAKGFTNIEPPTPVNDGCFLCYENIQHTDPDEVALSWEGPISGNKYEIYANYFPVFNQHFVLNNRKHVRQHMFAPEIADMLYFLEKAPGFRIMYNGKDAGASQPEHQHYQGTSDRLPIEDYDGSEEVLSKSRGVSVSYFSSYPAAVFSIEGKNKLRVARKAGQIALLLDAGDINIDAVFLYSENTKQFKVLIFPRKEQFYVIKSDFRLRPGSPEMSGLMVVSKQEGRAFFNQLAEEEISEILKSVSVPQVQLRYIYRYLSEETSYQQTLERLKVGDRFNDYDTDISVFKTSSAGTLDAADLESLNRDALNQALIYAQTSSNIPLSEVYTQAKLFKELARVNTNGVIVINHEDIPEGSQREEVLQAYHMDSPILQALEAELGCMIRLRTQLTAADVAGKEVVLISNQDVAIPGQKNIKRIGFQSNAINVTGSYYPLMPLICISTQLFGENTLESLTEALNKNNLFQRVFGYPATEDMIQNFLTGGIFELPVPRFNYEKVEDLQRQAILAAIAA